MRYQFGEFIVDADARQLSRADAVVHVSPKAFDLLVLLIRERPRALPKAELHARLWPNTFVSDASLAMLVAEARAALGESARQPRSVRTVHRHGYGFQAAVAEVPAAAPVTAAGPGYWLVTPASQAPLLLGQNIIGRDPEARVWLDAPGVSRRHACIRVEPGRVTLQDLGSKNGTLVNGARVVAPTALNDNDAVRFGSVSARFRAGADDPTRTEGDS